MTLDELNVIAPEIVKQIQDFNKSGTLVGGDIVIPTGDYGSKFAGTPFDQIY